MRKILFILIASIFVTILSFFPHNAHAMSYQYYSSDINNVLQNQKYNGTIPYLTIRFDDTDSTQIQALTNITKFDLPAVWFLSPAFLDQPGRPTWQQATDLYNSGIEIGSHTETHYVLYKNTTQATLQYQIVQSKIDLQNKGFKIFGFAFPNDVITTDSSAVVNQNYNFTTVPLPKQNTVFSIENDGQPFLLTIPVLHGNTVSGFPPTLETFDQVKAQVDSAIANKTWVVLLFHRIDDTGLPTHTSPHLFWQILQYVDQQSKLGKIKVVSPAQGLGMMGMSNTAITIAPEVVEVSKKSTTTFHANVVDNNPGNKITPTGVVVWSDDGAGGKFSPTSSCTLTQLQTLGTCSILYITPKNIHQQITIRAAYSGDDVHRPSTDAATINLRR